MAVPIEIALPGQIDVDLAKYLGVNTLLAGGAFEAFLLDGVSPGPEAPYRSGEIDTGQLTLVVPEPPLALLSLIGVTASMWRRRGNQRAQRESITTAACRPEHGCMTVPRDARQPQRG